MTGSIKENDREAAVGKNSRQNNNKKIASNREYGGDNEDLIYKSGIPTLRSSAHRVKFDVKRRKGFIESVSRRVRRAQRRFYFDEATDIESVDR